MVHKLCYWLVLGLLLFVIYATSQLAFLEWTQPQSCPLIGPIPACYLVLFCFIGALISHVFTKNSWWFFGFVSIVALIASIGTFGQIFDFLQCPRSSSGIPMCFLSLAFCLSLLIGKWFQVR